MVLAIASIMRWKRGCSFSSAYSTSLVSRRHTRWKSQVQFQKLFSSQGETASGTDYPGFRRQRLQLHLQPPIGSQREARAPALAASCAMPGARPFCARSAGSTTHLPISIALLRSEPSLTMFPGTVSRRGGFPFGAGSCSGQWLTRTQPAGLRRHEPARPGVEVYRVRVCIAPIVGFELRSSAIGKESGSAKRFYLV